MKVLFLFPYPLGRAPSQRFRFEHYIGELSDVGTQCYLSPFMSPALHGIFYDRGYVIRKTWGLIQGTFRRLAVLLTIHRYDYIFIHRESMPVGPPLLEWIAVKIFRRKIIFDFDDAIWIANSSENNRFFSRLKFHSNVFRICRWSYKVSVGNEYLRNAVLPLNKKVFLIPTTIDTNGSYSRHRERDHSVPVVGWTGSHSTYIYIAQLFPLIRKLSKNLEFRFIIISDRQPENGGDFFEFIQWKEESEVSDLLKMDIGLMPLTRDPWSEGKCGLKALQYLSLGIPAVVSPVGVNEEIVEHGINGFICRNDGDWIKYLTSLITDRELVKRLGEGGRAKVAAGYSVESNTAKFLNLFT